MDLKPQELLVLFKVASGKRPWTYAALAEALFMSPSEVHASVKRALAAGLAISNGRGHWAPLAPALIEFAIHGVRYAFPAEIGAVKRGVPTSFGAAPLSSLIAGKAGDAPVWPHPQGTARGPSVAPIYRTVAQACMADPALHQMLALLDALRIGRSRERALAQKLLTERLHLGHAA